MAMRGLVAWRRLRLEGVIAQRSRPIQFESRQVPCFPAGPTWRSCRGTDARLDSVLCSAIDFCECGMAFWCFCSAFDVVWHDGFRVVICCDLDALALAAE